MYICYQNHSLHCIRCTGYITLLGRTVVLFFSLRKLVFRSNIVHTNILFFFLIYSNFNMQVLNVNKVLSKMRCEITFLCKISAQTSQQSYHKSHLYNLYEFFLLNTSDSLMVLRDWGTHACSQGSRFISLATKLRFWTPKTFFFFLMSSLEKASEVFYDFDNMTIWNVWYSRYRCCALYCWFLLWWSKQRLTLQDHMNKSS